MARRGDDVTGIQPKTPTVYLVIMEAVYDHGVWGVYSDLDAAKARCRELYGRSDGHHSFRIEAVSLDTSVIGEGLLVKPRGLPGRRLLNPPEPSVVVPKVDTLR